MEAMKSFFDIGFTTINLFSMVLGAMFGLCTSVFNRYLQWLWVVGYFAGVAFYYALKAGAFNKLAGM
ncbi:hypothetical protein M0R04_04530 [Candidatus Dojkabacteria bacterium]|jgi:hypothetical protein|nr:hypothetical protein [Candidatus Dojkabacteria bacterium]